MPWTDGYAAQSGIVEDMEKRVQKLRLETVPATYINTAQPNKADLDSAWSIKESKTMQMPPNSYSQWFDPQAQTIQNMYLNLPSISPNYLSVQSLRENLPQSEIIGEFYKNESDGAVASWTASWTKVYRYVWFYWQVRSTAAVTAASWQIRPNALATAIYSHAASKVDRTPQATFDAAYNATNGWSVGNIPGSTANNRHIFGQGIGTIYFPDSATQAKSGFFDSIWVTNNGAGATELRHNSGGWHINTLTPITSILFLPQTGFANWSKITVLGFHPTT